MSAHDEAPLTSRSGSAQMHERPANFPTAGEALEAAMQDLSDPADAGKAAPPSRDHTNTLIRLQRRMRAVTPHELPIVLRGVLLAVAGRADEHAHAYPCVKTIAFEAGTTPNTARQALDVLIGLGWLGVVKPATARMSATYLVRFEPEPPDPAGVPQRYPRGEAPRAQAAAPQGRSSSTPGVKERSPRGAAALRRGAAAAPEDHRKDPREDHRQDPKPPIAHARGRGVKGKAQTTIAFEPVQPKATDSYAQAWVDGNADAGSRVSTPTAGGISTLGRAAATHARYRDGEPITGAELLRWIRVKARKFREGVEDPDKQRGGMTPYGFLLWLDDDPDTRAIPWRRPEERERDAAAARQPPPPEPKPVYTLVDQERAIKFQRRLQGLPDLAPEDLTAAAQRALATREAQTAHG